MRNLIITYISILCLALVLVSQIVVVVNYYHAVNESLKRETNAVLTEAYHTELQFRQKSLNGGTSSTTSPHPKSADSAVYTLVKIKINDDDLPGSINTAINDVVSKKSPLSIQKLNSIIAAILQERNIKSLFVIRVINPTTGKVLESSKKSFAESGFLIYSKPLALDFENKKSLQLILLNPMGHIFKRMGALLISSLLMALFGVYGIWFLFRTQARQKKLMAVKNDFFGNTAHELKRPVTQLYMALEALSTSMVDDDKEKKRRYLTISREATKDMSEKITMIMALAMDEEGVFRLNYSQFNLAEELEKLKEQFSTVSNKEVSIEIENTVDDANIKADRDHLRQCIANLIDNAIKYSGASVLISISIRRIKNSLCVSVKDNGIGIKPEKVERVFTKYTRLNTESGSPAGFGIGLSYVKTVVEKHAGRIEVKSEPEKGSEFIVYLPT